MHVECTAIDLVKILRTLVPLQNDQVAKFNQTIILPRIFVLLSFYHLNSIVL